MDVQLSKNPIKAAADLINLGINWALNFLVSFVNIFFAAIQRWFGLGSMPYVFALPNLLIFGIFILFPMLFNFVYATTGGIEFFPAERTWVGADNFNQLLTCENFFDPNTCREDLFWRAVSNSIFYVVAQVSLMVLISLLTAVVLNRKIKGTRVLP